MPNNVTIPPLGESVSEAVLIRWLKNDGDVVAKSDPLAELETDKANVELPAEAAGRLRHSRKAGETVKVGDVIAQIEEGVAGQGSAPAKSEHADSIERSPKAAQPSSTGQGGRIEQVGKIAQPAAPASILTAPASGAGEKPGEGKPEDLAPSVRRLVAEGGVNVADVAGTGRGDRITKEDVVRHVELRGPAPDASESRGNGHAAEKSPPAPLPAPPVILAPERPRNIQSPLPASAPGAEDNGVKRVPISKIRKRIAENLVRAQQTAAILTTFNQVDMTNIMAIRGKYKERFQEVHGIGLGFMSFFARAVTLALREFPRVNAFIEGDDFVYHDYVHLGVAVSTERGLTVPVLRHVETMSFAKIESEIKRLALAARDGKLGIAELSGGTFTITNGGVFGSLLSTPILNPPQSGILGMHAIERRPVAVGDKVEIHPMMYVALSYDHRTVDGRESVSFLVRLKEYLEDPARLMLEI